MKGKKLLIVKTAIELFNQHGVGNVRVHDIADKAGISPGNLTYHFKTKKELMLGIHNFRNQAFEEMVSGKAFFKESYDTIIVTREYLKFQIEFRFFYRDILEITRLCPEIKSAYESQIQRIISYNKTVLFLMVGKGLIQPEPHEGHFEILARNGWAILNAWLTAYEILGAEKVNITDGIRGVLEIHYHNFTEKGRAFYYQAIERLPEWVGSEMVEI